MIIATLYLHEAANSEEEDKLITQEDYKKEGMIFLASGFPLINGMILEVSKQCIKYSDGVEKIIALIDQVIGEVTINVPEDKEKYVSFTEREEQADSVCIYATILTTVTTNNSEENNV